MLTSDQIEVLRELSGQVVDPVVDFLVKDIARRVSEAGQLTSTAAYQVWRAQDLGVSQKKLKKELKDQYSFQRKFQNATIQEMITHLEKGTSVVEVAILTVGVVRLDAVLYWDCDGYQLGYDLMVRDAINSPMWICYDSLTDAVNIPSKRVNMTRLEIKLITERDGHLPIPQFADKGLVLTKCIKVLIDLFQKVVGF